MMHSQAIVVAPNAPTGLAATIVGTGNRQSVALTWTDNSINETGFTIEKTADPSFLTGVTSASVGVDVTTYSDPNFDRRATVYYRVFASNVVGDIDTVGFPYVNAVSGYSNSVWAGLDPTPAAPTNLTAQQQAGPSVLLTWTDNATNETGFVVERSDNGGAFVQIASPGPRNNTGNVTYSDTAVIIGNSYSYRVRAVNGPLSSAYSNTASVTISTPPAGPADPSNVTAAGVQQNNNRSRINVNWTDNSNNETGFEIQLATDANFTAGLINAAVGANVATYQTSNLNRGVSYYVRVRAVNGPSASAWVNATPFPVITP